MSQWRQLKVHSRGPSRCTLKLTLVSLACHNPLYDKVTPTNTSRAGTNSSLATTCLLVGLFLPPLRLLRLDSFLSISNPPFVLFVLVNRPVSFFLSEVSSLLLVSTSSYACFWILYLLLFYFKTAPLLLAFFAWLACLCLNKSSTYSYALELAADYWLAGLSLSTHWVGNYTMKLCPFPPNNKVSKQIKTLTLMSLL